METAFVPDKLRKIRPGMQKQGKPLEVPAALELAQLGPSLFHSGSPATVALQEPSNCTLLSVHTCTQHSLYFACKPFVSSQLFPLCFLLYHSANEFLPFFTAKSQKTK